MDPRISLITLGVADMTAARTFYEKLGWRTAGQSNDDVTFFQAGGMILGFYGRAALAADAKVDDSAPGFSGIALAYNGRDKEEVDRVLAEAVAAGGTLIKAAEDVFWGGYSGYFADPDGHLWEVAYNPFFPIADDGSISLGDAD
ncbi:MAG: VOC family protein [Rhodospirillales bacterium]|nr:VOC family protein [Rhodospirillales bacterium]MBO6785325.1 VOC family protein [Rhodospirillales bacterium]